MDKREQRKKLSFTNTQNIFDVLFWTTLAIVLGLVASFIFFPRILAQAQISSLTSEAFFLYFSSLVPDLEMWYTNYENYLNF